MARGKSTLARIIAGITKPTSGVVFVNDIDTENKAELQNKINNYIEKGEGENPNIAFVQVDNLPTYKLCLLKKNVVTNDDEIYAKVKEQGIDYYRYYAILDNQEERQELKKYDHSNDDLEPLTKQSKILKQKQNMKESLL